MALAAGTRLGPYEILSPLGAGGMGEVYRAKDARLGREVAVKVLPAALSRDGEALSRFEREVRAVAALNHPNILAIYDFSSHEGTACAVTELLQGQTLREALTGGPLPLRKALDVSLQLCAGLAAAHAAGIVHRDLKPENVFVTRDGRVKILDFGLARRVGSPSAGEATLAPTLPQLTEPGMILGTVGYMAPEQVRGRTADARSDIFALGAILYEMLSGQRAFRRDNAGDTLSAILRDEPGELAAPGRNIPPALERIVHHCLEKDPAERFQSARDLAFALESAGAAPAPGTASAPGGAPPRRRPGILLAAALAGLAAGFAADRALRRAPSPALVAIRPLTHSGGDYFPAVSPDGATLAFASNRDGTMRIWLKQLATGDEAALTAGPDFRPRFAPDGSQLLFIHGDFHAAPTAQATATDLYRVPVIGGIPRRIAPAASDADWSPDGRTIAFVRLAASPTASSLLVVPAEGGEPKEIARWADRFAGPPRFSPEGTQIGVPTVPALAGGGARFEIVAADGSSRRSLAVPTSLGTLSNAVWDGRGGSIVFTQSLQARFGSSRLVREEVGSGRAVSLAWLGFEVNALDAIGAGRLVADSATSRQNLAEFDLAHPAAPPRWLTRGTSDDRQPVYSPDGAWVAFSSNRSGNLDIWAVSTKTGQIRRITEDDSDDWDPGFTRDGKLVWSSGRTGHLEIWTAEADGTSPHPLTRHACDAENPTSGPDGSIFYALTSSPNSGLWRLKPGASDPERVGSCLNIPEISPDGRYVACPELGVGPLRVARVADGAFLPFTVEVPHPRVTETQMGRARWSGDGKRLFYVGQDENGVNGIFEQDFDPQRKETRSTRRKLVGFDPSFEAESFAISPDGAHLVVAFLERTYGIVTIEGLSGAERPAHRR